MGEAGLTFIGPAPDAIAAMGDKTRARDIVSAAGVPVVPAVQEPPADPDERLVAAERLGFPLLIKAAAGGGGKGMRIVRAAAEFPAAFAAAEREARSAFGDGRLFLERYFERRATSRCRSWPTSTEPSCISASASARSSAATRRSSRRRPSPAVTPNTRETLTAAAVAAARSVGYTNAGTVEFLYTDGGEFHFLEMNTRLQVEHPITEWVTGIDLVQAQIRIAAGEALWLRQEDVALRGHAIECRVYAEDPAQHFLPSPGRIAFLREPQGPGVRVDSGIVADYDVPLHYDPMLAKLSVWAGDRDAARRRMIAALRDYVVLGITTSIPFLTDLLAHPRFADGATHTHFIDENMPAWQPGAAHTDAAAVAAALYTVLAPSTAAPCGLPFDAPAVPLATPRRLATRQRGSFRLMHLTFRHRNRHLTAELRRGEERGVFHAAVDGRTFEVEGALRRPLYPAGRH